MNEDFEAVVAVRLRVEDRQVAINAVIDTGFSEFLMLPTLLLKGLGAVIEDESQVTLGDGSVVLLDVYVVEIDWLGSWQSVKTLASDGDALIGMRLLDGHDLQVCVVPGGEVRVVPL